MIKKSIDTIPFPFLIIDETNQSGSCFNNAYINFRKKRRIDKKIAGKIYFPLTIQQVRKTKKAIMKDFTFDDPESKKILIRAYGIPFFNTEGRLTKIIEFLLKANENGK